MHARPLRAKPAVAIANAMRSTTLPESKSQFEIVDRVLTPQLAMKVMQPVPGMKEIQVTHFTPIAVGDVDAFCEFLQTWKAARLERQRKIDVAIAVLTKAMLPITEETVHTAVKILETVQTLQTESEPAVAPR